MQIFVNDKPTEVREGCTVADFLISNGYGSKQGIAIAINGAIVQKKQWNRYTLKSGDMLSIIGAFYGG